MPASSKVPEDRSPVFAADKMKQRSQMGELPVLLPLHSLDLGSIAGQRQMEVLRDEERWGREEEAGGTARLLEVRPGLGAAFHLFNWE